MRELNLIPYEIKEKEIKTEKKRKYISYIILALCIIFVIAYFPIMYSISREKKASELKNQVNSKSYITENYNRLKTSIEDIKKPITIAEETEKNKVFLTVTINNLSKYIPKDITFTGISYQSGEMSINGESLNYNSCCEFIANLELSDEFKTAKISGINLNNDNKTYSFVIKIPQKGVADNEQVK